VSPSLRGVGVCAADALQAEAFGGSYPV